MLMCADLNSKSIAVSNEGGNPHQEEQQSQTGAPQTASGLLVASSQHTSQPSVSSAVLDKGDGSTSTTAAATTLSTVSSAASAAATTAGVAAAGAEVKTQVKQEPALGIKQGSSNAEEVNIECIIPLHQGHDLTKFISL